MASKIPITQDALNKALNRKRFAWVDSVMKDEVPADIYGSMHSLNFDDRSRAVHWLRERGYHVDDVGDGVLQVFKGTTLLRQTKLVLELEKPEELVSVMEAVAENINIPPPPWNPKRESS